MTQKNDIVIETTIKGILNNVLEEDHKGFMLDFEGGARDSMVNRLKYYIRLIEEGRLKLKHENNKYLL